MLAIRRRAQSLSGPGFALACGSVAALLLGSCGAEQGMTSGGGGGSTGGSIGSTGAGGRGGSAGSTAGTTGGAAGTTGGAAGTTGGAAGTTGAGGRGGSGVGAAGSGGGVAGGAGHAGSGGVTAGSGGHAGTSGASGAGGTSAAGQVFGQCRFHFGTIDSIATGSPAMIPQLDFFTPGWMGQKDTFDMGTTFCTEAKSGGTLGNQVPVIVAYVAAFYVKRHSGLCDCNVTTCGANKDLCHAGAADINSNLTAIINVYKSYAQGLAGCYGTTRPIIFEMEPDFYQYTISNQSQPWTATQAGQIMSQFVAAVKTSLPNAVFSMDISPWVAPNDGADNGATWYSSFDMSLFTFINTSGGSTDAATAKIRGDAMTWAGVSKVTGKPILADTGYGVNGSSAGPDPAWDSPANINARIADGVVSISQYNPSSSWGTTISGNRSQINTPRTCP